MDEFYSLITSRIGGETILSVHWSSRSPTNFISAPRMGLEDAVHLYTLFEESLSVARLEEWVTRLGVEDEYERLKRA